MSFFKVLRQAFSNVEIESLDQDLNKNKEFRVVETVETTVETSLDMLKCHFQSVETFSTCQDKLFQMSRSRVSIEISKKNREFRVIKTVETTVKTSLDMLKRPSFKVLRQAFSNVEIESLIEISTKIESLG
jgi:hypothetical protein